MGLSQEIAKHFRQVHFGGNWTSVNLKDTLAGLSWQDALKQVYSLNTIATLVYHTHYFVKVTKEVLEGQALNAHDKYSFDHPPIISQQDWEDFLNKVWADAELFADLVEQLPDEKLWENFSEEKYGSYYSNIQGIIEHTHYHLGQIVIIKKMLSEANNAGT